MHGAHKAQEAELRPPSLKGLMRFWFRALVGGSVDLDLLRKLEAEVFGSTEFGQGISVRIEGSIPQATPHPFLLPHKPDHGSIKDKLRSPSPALMKGENFHVLLMDRPFRNKKFIEVAAWSLWVGVNLGGFGQRSRRGAGSLLLQKVEPEIPNMASAANFSEMNDLRDYLQLWLKTAMKSVQDLLALKTCNLEAPSPSPPSNSNLPPFPILYNPFAKIQISLLNAADEQEARAQIMQEIARYKNLAWGLPYGSPANGESPVKTRMIYDNNGTRVAQPARMASPVWFHLVPRNGGGWFLINTLMKSQFPDGRERQPDWGKITNYFNGDKTAIQVFLP